MKVFTCVLAVVLATTWLGMCSANSRHYGQNPWVSNGMGGHMYNPNAGVNSYSFSNPSGGVNSNSFSNSFRRRTYGQNPWVSNGMGGHMYNHNAGVNSYSFSNPSGGVNSNSFSNSFRRLRRRSIAEE